MSSVAPGRAFFRRHIDEANHRIRLTLEARKEEVTSKTKGQSWTIQDVRRGVRTVISNTSEKRNLETRIKEHKEDVEKASTCRPYTRSNRKTLEKYMHKSAITDHMTQQNHIIDWAGAKFIDRIGLENKRHKRSDMDKENQRQQESRWGPIPTLTYLR